MRTDDKTYEYGGIYEDEADEYIDGDEIEVFDYPEDDEDENTLWDDEDTADTDESPERKRKKQKKEIVLADSEDADDELSERHNGRLQRNGGSLMNWKPMLKNTLLRMTRTAPRNSPKGNCWGGSYGRRLLPVWRMLPERKEISRMSLHGGTSWMPTENARSVITRFPAAVMMFPLTMGQQRTACSFPTP